MEATEKLRQYTFSSPAFMEKDSALLRNPTTVLWTNNESKLKIFYKYWPFHSLTQQAPSSNFNSKVYRTCKTSTALEKNDQNTHQPAQLSRSCHCECSCASLALLKKTKRVRPESVISLKAGAQGNSDSVFAVTGIWWTAQNIPKIPMCLP